MMFYIIWFTIISLIHIPVFFAGFYRLKLKILPLFGAVSFSALSSMVIVLKLFRVFKKQEQNDLQIEMEIEYLLALALMFVVSSLSNPKNLGKITSQIIQIGVYLQCMLFSAILIDINLNDSFILSLEKLNEHQWLVHPNIIFIVLFSTTVSLTLFGIVKSSQFFMSLNLPMISDYESTSYVKALASICIGGLLFFWRWIYPNFITP